MLDGVSRSPKRYPFARHVTRTRPRSRHKSRKSFINAYSPQFPSNTSRPSARSGVANAGETAREAAATQHTIEVDMSCTCGKSMH